MKEPTIMLYFECEECEGVGHPVASEGHLGSPCKLCDGSGGKLEKWPITKLMKHLLINIERMPGIGVHHDLSKDVYDIKWNEEA
jgi:hypothetical protein